MEYIIGVILALLGGLFFYKKKADKAAVDSKLAEAKGKDSILEGEQFDLKEEIKKIDERLELIRKEREASNKENTKNLSLKEIRDRIKNGKKIR